MKNPFDPAYIPQLLPSRNNDKAVRASRKKAQDIGSGWGGGTIALAGTPKRDAPGMMSSMEGKRYMLPSKRVVLVGKVRGTIVHCTYIDNGEPVDFDRDTLLSIGTRA